MITIIGIVFLFYLVAEIVKQSAVNKARKREMARQARIAEEMRKDREERRRIAEENKRIVAEQIEQAKALAQFEREQRKQQAEQERQAAMLQRHEERLFKIEQKLELAERDEKHYSDEVTAITIDIRGIEAYIEYMKGKGLPCKTKEAELEKLSKKLYAAETKVIKARQARELCERQMQTV